MLCWRHELAVQTSFAPTATLTSIYVNAHLPEGEQGTDPEDFIPGARTNKPQFARGVIPVTPEMMRARFSAYSTKLNAPPGKKA